MRHCWGEHTEVWTHSVDAGPTAYASLFDTLADWMLDNSDDIHVQSVTLDHVWDEGLVELTLVVSRLG